MNSYPSIDALLISLNLQFLKLIRKQLGNVAILMHCNLRPTDAALVLTCFNYDAKMQVGQYPSFHVLQRFTADKLRYAVTLTFVI